MTRHLDKAFIETKIVSNGVLPSLLIVAVIREILHDVLVNSIESQSFFGTLSDSQHDEGVVGIAWFFIRFLFSILFLITDATCFTVF